MIYSANDIRISLLHPSDALQLNKFLVSNAERFIQYLPKTLADNSTFEGTQRYIKRKIKAAKKQSKFVYLIHDQHSSAIVGMIILKDLDWKSKKGEFAYCIDKQFKGKGLMAKAIQAIALYAFETLGLETLQIVSQQTNISSINVAINSGFKWIKTLKYEFVPLKEHAQEMELYELSRSDRL